MRRRYVVMVCPSCLEQQHHDADGNYDPCSDCDGHPQPVEVSLPASAGKVRSLVYKVQVADAQRRIARVRERT